MWTVSITSYLALRSFALIERESSGRTKSGGLIDGAVRCGEVSEVRLVGTGFGGECEASGRGSNLSSLSQAGL